VGHDWQIKVRDGMPVLQCSHCKHIWWPDKNQPRHPCRLPVHEHER
jgi:uncharacterized C2H2 Zn-finger protein